MARYLNATWLSQSWQIFGEFADFQDNFNPEVGFLPRRGIRTTKLHLEWNPRPDRWGLRVLSPMYKHPLYDGPTESACNPGATTS